MGLAPSLSQAWERGMRESHWQINTGRTGGGWGLYHHTCLLLGTGAVLTSTVCYPETLHAKDHAYDREKLLGQAQACTQAPPT